MFVLVQFPVADLRSLVKEQMGRLPVPDWSADDPGRVFIRGFGAVATRNSPGYGLLGERCYADFDHALRFRQPVLYQEEGWRNSFEISPWFRRFYFDGIISGRFELGFIVKDSVEQAAIGDGTSIDARQVASKLAITRVTIIGNDVPEQDTTLGQIAEPMALAYLANTTKKNSLIDFPLTDTLGRYVDIGSPTFHVRMSNGRSYARGKDGQSVSWGVNELFLTSAADGQRRRNTIVQPSLASAGQETGQERAVRVLFSHLNSLIFALSKLLAAEKAGTPSIRRGTPSIRREDKCDLVAQLIARLALFTPTGPKNDDDVAFSEAIIGFARAHTGRIDELKAKLEALGEDLKKPTTVQSAAGYARSLFELIVGKTTETVVGAALKHSGG